MADRRMLVCGVDEAGRGSVLGPLVVAGVLIDSSKIRKLSALGVKDSKQLSPSKRKQLYKKILSFVDEYYVVKISPKTVDYSVQKHQLNNLEAKYMGKVISKLEPDLSYVDSCDVNPRRFRKEISRYVKNGTIRCTHHADSRFPIVSAASIVAKVSRDRVIERLRKKHELGSGYPSDYKTMKFVSNWIFTKKEAPTFVRTSWKPVRNLMAESALS